MNNKTNLIIEYLHKVKKANKELTKKEAFKDLLNRLYSNDKEILRLIDKITLGAERTVLNIPRKDKIHKGSADTLYNKIIIEFENDLNVTLTHAKEQLAGYLLGQLRSGEGYNFTLIASDFITWKVFAPDVTMLDRIEELQEHELPLNEVKSSSFVLTERNADDFYYWIDRFLFKEEKQKATLKRIEEAFGYQSNIFIESFRELSRWFNEAKRFGEVQVSFEQWEKFLSIAYGSFDARDNIFLIHTYLSIFSKMLAYSIVSNDDYIDDSELKSILDGTIFHRYNIRNFVDNDFFHWVNTERSFNNLKKVFRLIAQEISNFNFDDVDEDVLKGVYQELIDIDTRHALGEYYTPDWLCERIVKEFHFTSEGPGKTSKILDPACGSGSFLRAAIHRIKELNPDVTVEELSDNIYGIDIHPLSVQIAKTTLLIALGKEVINAKKPVHLNIILANTLLAPEGVENLFGGEFRMNIDKEKYLLTTQVLDDVGMFDEALSICDDLAEQTMGRKKETEEVFENIFRRHFSKGGINPQIIESFYKIYTGLKTVKEKGRDSIWKFIVQNLYKPYFLSGKFDYVIGNPPWFTYSSIRNEDYQDVLNVLADKYEVKPVKVANFPHLEIAAIFFAYCSSYFLNDKGKIAFVLPRSFFSADHHDNTRSGKAKGFKITQIWDLDEVSPLFRIPSSVFFAEKHNKKSVPLNGVPGIKFSGKVSNESNTDLIPEEKNVKWYYVKQGKASAISSKKTKSNALENPYKKHFRQGATIVPRAFYFIDIDLPVGKASQDYPKDFNDRIINIKTSEAIKADAKKPWKGIELKGKIESRFIFRTALAKSILPFALYKPDLVVLPVLIETNQENKKEIKLLSANELMQEGYLNVSRWFKNVENIWDINKTEKNEKITSENYLNWQNKLTDQKIDKPYLVLYNTSGKDANCTIVEREKLDLEFLVDHKNYLLALEQRDEALYISAILNSSIPNKMMKDFQSRGLFGERDIHKKILDIYFPRFDETDEIHIRLAEISETAHKKASEYLQNNPPQKELTAIHLGRLRLQIKKHLSQEMKEIDKLVKKVVG